ncbi:hypothetical protein MMG03_002549 [Fibrobacter succinogenes]|nr:hypothetical protein [Fibrobacter succinogenes]
MQFMQKSSHMSHILQHRIIEGMGSTTIDNLTPLLLFYATRNGSRNIFRFKNIDSSLMQKNSINFSESRMSRNINIFPCLSSARLASIFSAFFGSIKASFSFRYLTFWDFQNAFSSKGFVCEKSLCGGLYRIFVFWNFCR